MKPENREVVSKFRVGRTSVLDTFGVVVDSLWLAVSLSLLRLPDLPLPCFLIFLCAHAAFSPGKGAAFRRQGSTTPYTLGTTSPILWSSLVEIESVLREGSST